MRHDADRRVDEVREHLRSLGYLDARLDRFVLGGSRPAGIAAASARIGMLAGVLLGPAAAIGVGLRLPGLVTGVTDALVLALYLAVAFGAAAAGTAALGILAGGLAARRAGRTRGLPRRAARSATLAGVLVSAACLVYLVLWWRAAVAAPTPVPTLMTAGMLVVAVGISLILGHAVMVTVLAWLAQSGLGASLPSGLPWSSRRAIAALGLTTLAGAIALLVMTSPRGGSDDTPPLVVVPTGERVLVLAIDGVDRATVERLNAAGRLPVLGPVLVDDAATIASDENRDPARVWTTIATGQPAERHGIAGLETRRVAGVDGRFTPDAGLWATVTAATDLLRLTRPSLASGNERRVPAFWEVAARAGLRTAVVHWWATWPASEHAGIVLTDRALLRLQQGGEPNGEIAPASLYETLQPGWEGRRARAIARAARALPEDGVLAEDIEAIIRRSAELDATLIDLATDPALGALDLLALYLPGLDIAQHALFGTSERGALPPSASSARLASLERYYEFLDASLAGLFAAGDGAATPRLVVAITQPGRVRGTADGVLALSGGSAGSGRTALSPEAVAPTVLFALGVPLAEDLPASPALALFSQEFVTAHPPTAVTTYGTTAPPAVRQGRPLDAEMIERMRSLGYVR